MRDPSADQTGCTVRSICPGASRLSATGWGGVGTSCGAGSGVGSGGASGTGAAGGAPPGRGAGEGSPGAQAARSAALPAAAPSEPAPSAPLRETIDVLTEQSTGVSPGTDDA